MWSLLVLCSLTRAYGQCQEASQCGLDNQAFLQLRESPGSASTEKDIRIPAICPSRLCPDEKVEDHTSANLTVLFAFHCPEEGLKKLHQDLMEISDPQHERYGKWLSKQEADSLCDPDKTVVESWLRDHNLTPEESWPRHLRVKLSPAQAEKLFKTSIHRYKRGDRTVVQAEDYFLPHKVNEVISAIYGLSDLPLREASSPPPAPPAPPARPAQASESPDIVQQLQELFAVFPIPERIQNATAGCLKFISGLLTTLKGDVKNGVAVQQQWVDGRVLGGIPNQPTFDQAFLAGPDVVKQMYQVPKSTAPVHGTEANQSVLVISKDTGIGTNMYSTLLAQWYQDFYGQQATNVQVLGKSFDDMESPDMDVTEANVDIQLMVGVGPNIPTYAYGVLDSGGALAFKEYFSKLAHMENSPLVISVSHALQPIPFDEKNKGYQQILNMETDLALVAARGRTVVVASGDDGAGYGYLPAEGPDSFYANSNITGEYFFTVPADSVEDCKVVCGLTHRNTPRYNVCGAWLFEEAAGTCTMFNMGMPYEKTKGSGFVGGPEIVAGPMGPTWPPMSPWVTSVGSTAPWRNGEFLNQWMPERATNHFGSGGGFMCPYPTEKGLEIFKKATMDQRAAVENYQKGSNHVKPSPSDKCQKGRGFPDVASLGTNLAAATRKAGKFRCCNPVSGTSASAPIFAAIISHLNVERLARGMPPMGFINQWLYQNSDVFNDVTEGANNIGRVFTYGAQEKYGYSAAQGWDPVTGLGTPNYPKMLQRSSACSKLVR
ncbi:aorO [Symbiodinium sp. CCMP2592]|nr:aorO [Symbiodinium sp. CCMP2592]